MIVAFDHTLFQVINQGLANPVLDAICPTLRDKYTWIPLYVAGSIYLILKYRLHGLWMVAFAGLAILVSDQTSNLLKEYIHRVRPCHVEPGVRLLISTCSNTYSFTSNHAANHFALSVFISMLYRNRWLTVLLLLWAASVAFSQIYVGIHYPGDVTGGALLGTSIGLLVFLIFDKTIRRRQPLKT